MVLIKGSSWILIQLPFLVHAYYKIKMHKAGTNNVKREKPSSAVECNCLEISDKNLSTVPCKAPLKHLKR